MLNYLKKATAYLFREMPLKNNFKNYDEYWKNRGFINPATNRGKIISEYIKKKQINFGYWVWRRIFVRSTNQTK
jgi:hypothetical protein